MGALHSGASSAARATDRSAGGLWRHVVEDRRPMCSVGFSREPSPVPFGFSAVHIAMRSYASKVAIAAEVGTFTDSFPLDGEEDFHPRA